MIDADKEESYLCEVVYNKATKLPVRQIFTLNGLMESPPDDRPAETHFDDRGQPKRMIWRSEDIPHRDPSLGPAMIVMHETTRVNLIEHYKFNGLSHRSEFEPAYIERDERGNIVRTEYYLHGNKISPPAAGGPKNNGPK